MSINKTDTITENENMERFIDKFAEKALNSTGSFMLSVEYEKFHRQRTDYYNFMPYNIGEARYIYGMRVTDNPIYFIEKNISLRLFAIVKDNMVYILSLEDFHLFKADRYDLPQNVCYIEDFRIEKETEFINSIFIDLYRSIEYKPISYIPSDLKRDFRERIITGEKIPEIPEIGMDILNDDLIMGYLSGFVNLEAIVKASLEKPTLILSTKKARHEKKRELANGNTIVKEWERRLYRALNLIDTATAMAVFEYGGKKASNYVKTHNIIRKLIRKENILTVDFISKKEGQKVMDELGINGDINKLLCEHICEIKSESAVLFTRETHEEE